VGRRLLIGSLRFPTTGGYAYVLLRCVKADTQRTGLKAAFLQRDMTTVRWVILLTLRSPGQPTHKEGHVCSPAPARNRIVVLYLGATIVFAGLCLIQYALLLIMDNILTGGCF
jgi:hypothetical protein